MTTGRKFIRQSCPPGVASSLCRDGKKIYAVVFLPGGEKIPAKIVWKGNEPARNSKLICLQTGKSVRWKKTAEGIEVALPAGLPKICLPLLLK